MATYKGVLLSRVYVEVDAMSEEDAEQKMREIYERCGPRIFAEGMDLVVIDRPDGFAQSLAELNAAVS